MNLANFIHSSESRIIELSVEFARTIPAFASKRINVDVLRDHLPHILTAIAADLEQSQSRTQGIAKAEGHGPITTSETAAQVHGRMRAEGGLSVEQVVSEYRVLRASISRLWTETKPALDATAASDLIRLNEAIDQAVAESVAFHSSEVERWRAMLLAIVGHDLRDPLNTIAMTTDLLVASVDKGPLADQIRLLKRGSDRLRVLLDSLLEYSNARLGSRMALHRSQVDLELASRREIELLRSAFPGAEIEVRAAGSLFGNFDESRVRQALSNLVANAVQYRVPDTGIEVLLEGRTDAVVLTVRNEGEPIDQLSLDALFEPLRRRDSARGGERQNFGLGLFIVKEIAMAHGGEAFAESRDGKIAFCINLPRKPTAD